MNFWNYKDTTKKFAYFHFKLFIQGRSVIKSYYLKSIIIIYLVLYKSKIHFM